MPRVLSYCALLCLVAGCGKGHPAGPAGPSYAQQVAETLQNPDAASRSRQLMTLGVRQFQAADLAGAEATLAHAKQACGEIRDAASQASAYALLVKAFVAINNRSAAESSLSIAADCLAKLPPGEAAIVAQAEFAEAQNGAGHAALAAASLKDAELAVAALTDPDSKILCLTTAAKAYQKLRDAPSVDRLLAEAIDAGKSLEKPRDRCRAIAAVALAQHGMKRNEESQATFRMALETARQIDDPLAKTYGLCEIAEKLAEAGDPSQARSLLAEAEQTAGQVTAADQQSLVREKIGGLRRQFGR